MVLSREGHIVLCQYDAQCTMYCKRIHLPEGACKHRRHNVAQQMDDNHGQRHRHRPHLRLYTPAIA